MKQKLTNLLTAATALKPAAISLAWATTKAAIVVASFGFLMVKAPQYHSSYIRNKVGSQVFLITNKKGDSGGTGFAVKAPSGRVYTLTNAHVCGVAENGVVYASSASMRKIPLQIIEKSINTDLCLLTSIPNKDGLEIGKSVQLGEQIGLVGHPHLMPITLSKDELIGYQDVKVLIDEGPCEVDEGMYKTYDSFFGSVCVEEFEAGLSNVPSLGGNSGSPVVNISGDVIAVLFAGNAANWGILVQLKDITQFLKAY
jgi:S1-C subfamily serine protease